MVWCGVVWCGVVWYGVVWYGMVWCGVVWYGFGMVWYTYMYMSVLTGNQLFSTNKSWPSAGTLIMQTVTCKYTLHAYATTVRINCLSYKRQPSGCIHIGSTYYVGRYMYMCNAPCTFYCDVSHTCMHSPISFLVLIVCVIYILCASTGSGYV